uniref:Putative lipocalin-6 1 n=1 Tax=Amblyomma americanum TaxID=6943 RepID=A0A0C9RY24_AMBAM
MAVFGKLMFCACILATFADQDGALSDGSATTTPVDGFNLLGVGNTYRLVQTSFHFQDNGTSRCFTANVQKKDIESHEVELQVDYNSVTADTWPSHSLKFQFQRVSGLFNEMKITGSRGVPSSTYIFLTTDPECIVIEAVDDTRNNLVAGAVKPDARDEHPEGTQRGNCMLWVQDEKETRPNNECFDKYSSLCPDRYARQSFSDTKCKKRTTENSGQKETKTLQ